ncbi:MAG: deoxyribonuclease I [Planctomycetes bacterium]|nr:deoxyribonuclease I [Planctomycetota bacterium]
MRHWYLVSALASLAFLTIAPAPEVAATPAAPARATNLRILSWNTRHMGWSGQQNWAGYAAQIWNQFGSTSSSTNGLDVVCLQEVMYDTSVTSLVSALNSVSGVSWSAATTAALGRSSYKERYSVLYRTDRVTLLSSTVWTDTGDKFEREPQIVKLRVNDTSADVTLLNWHTIFGTTAQRQAEIQEIANVFSSVQASSSTDQDVILIGDHNAGATSTWWNNLKGLSPAVSTPIDMETSINSSCAYVSKYDHAWYQASYVTEYSSSGRDYVSNVCTFYSGLSDHAPVWLKLYTVGDDD